MSHVLFFDLGFGIILLLIPDINQVCQPIAFPQCLRVVNRQHSVSCWVFPADLQFLGSRPGFFFTRGPQVSFLAVSSLFWSRRVSSLSFFFFLKKNSSPFVYPKLVIHSPLDRINNHRGHIRYEHGSTRINHSVARSRIYHRNHLDPTLSTRLLVKIICVHLKTVSESLSNILAILHRWYLIDLLRLPRNTYAHTVSKTILGIYAKKNQHHQMFLSVPICGEHRKCVPKTTYADAPMCYYNCCKSWTSTLRSDHFGLFPVSATRTLLIVMEPSCSKNASSGRKCGKATFGSFA